MLVFIYLFSLLNATSNRHNLTESTTQRLNLSNCDSQPIHIPGLIQPNGLLLTLHEPQLEILQMSEHVEQVHRRNNIRSEHSHFAATTLYAPRLASHTTRVDCSSP
ncbi:hypothetical protein DA73_0400003475 [Tolypothrix bouteillei VB521301]|uniref:PAS fold-2 domain-containing protein n=1 Tax=Tolypothrix bouteillei VB521301 TaxID=1479485 RepID=A0A8S9SW64_9CYAN|nr:hypothetical protein DA73_0400003475 [Tolypothrix bouteillei VB521301]